MSKDLHYEQLAAGVGADFQSRRVAPDPVCSALIRRWTEAFGDTNPGYFDSQTVHASGRKGAFAPPGMLAAFTGRGLLETRAGVLGQTALGNALKELGFITPGTGIEQIYETEILAGDTISEVNWPESISERKQTRLGSGFFITYRTDFINQHGQRVGVQRLSTFAFQLGKADAAAAPQESSAPSQAASDTTNQRPGEQLPPLEINLDRTGIIACTNAMGDFNPTHYDPELARASGFKDIFTDIYAAIGFAQAYVSNWAGGNARFTAINAKLGIPLYPGDTLHMSGNVAERKGQDLQIAVRGLCPAGLHLAATVRLTLSE